MTFCCRDGLQSAAFRDVEFRGVVWLDTSKCAPSGMLLGSFHSYSDMRYGSVSGGSQALLPQVSVMPGRTFARLWSCCDSMIFSHSALQLQGSVVLGTLLVAVMGLCARKQGSEPLRPLQELAGAALAGLYVQAQSGCHGLSPAAAPPGTERTSARPQLDSGHAGAQWHPVRKRLRWMCGGSLGEPQPVFCMSRRASMASLMMSGFLSVVAVCLFKRRVVCSSRAIGAKGHCDKGWRGHASKCHPMSCEAVSSCITGSLAERCERG